MGTRRRSKTRLQRKTNPGGAGQLPGARRRARYTLEACRPQVAERGGGQDDALQAFMFAVVEALGRQDDDGS